MQPINVVGTKNATQDVYHYIKPGKTRASLFRYFRFNLPRLTKLVLLALIAGLGLTASAVALSPHPPFEHAEIPLFIIVAAAVLFVVIGIFSSPGTWDLGLTISLAALVTYLGGIFGNAPYVWNGAPLGLAATWNLMMILSLIYVAAYWALQHRIIVAHPDDQGFRD